MELRKTPLEPETQSGEDFIHIDDPITPGEISLSESIVNVSKEELLKEDDDPIIDSDDIIGGEDDGERFVERTKLELPEELAKSVMVLTCESTEEGGSCDVYLVGTAHVSQVYIICFDLRLVS